MMKLILWSILLVTIAFHSIAGQSLSPQQQKYIVKNAKTICQTTTMSPTNWKKVLKETKDKQIVLLGEFTHGAKEVFLLRNKLIKALHEKQDFNIVLFESGIGELFYVDTHKDQLSPRQMTRGLFGPWHNKAFQTLMNYLKTEKMTVAGFDVQRSRQTFQELLNREAEKGMVDTTDYISLEERYTEIQRKLRNRKTIYSDEIETTTLQLVKAYQLVEQQLTAITKPTKATLFALQTIKNRKHSLRYRLQFLKDKDWNQRWIARDSMMAENVQWLIEHIYQSQKIIIVGHNFHIAKYNEKEEVMGEYLSKTYGDKMYAIGTYAASGIYADNGGNPKLMLPPDPESLDIKHFINQLNGYAHFLPIPSKSRKKGRQWLFEKIVVNDTFIDLSSSHTLNLAKHFDGLIFLQSVSLPDK